MSAISDRWKMNRIVKISLIRFFKILLIIATFHLAYAIPPEAYWIALPLVIGLFIIIDIGGGDDGRRGGDGPAGGPVDFSGNGDGGGNGGGD